MPSDEPISMLSQIPISDGEFEQLTKLIYNKFGIILSNEKRSLVMGRLQKYLRLNNYTTYTQYIEQLHNSQDLAPLSSLIDNISTNHTFFWRESEHFIHLANQALPEVCHRAKQKDHDLRIWCAGCSSGEEAYTLMAITMEFLGKEYGLWHAGLLATDISEKVLNTAIRGHYQADQIDPLPAPYKKYFSAKGDGSVEAHEKLKQEITFRRFNLMNPEFPFRKQFHIIFCRNVMIYFDLPTKEKVVNNFTKFLEPGGYLYIGHSESLGRVNDQLEYIMPAVYRKR